MDYLNFASKISFFEFIQNEFYDPQFRVDEYKDEISILKRDLTIETITKALETNPKLIDIFEEIFQLQRFTNSQYIHFCFDISTLNNSDDETIISHAEKSIFKFENGNNNDEFSKIYNRLNKNSNINNDSKEKVFCIKKTIMAYINKGIKDKNIFYIHFKNSISSRLRMAKYLVENLNADEFLKAINLEKYLKIKRRPRDTKRIHGNFGTIKIAKILEENNVDDVSSLISKRQITLKDVILPEKYQNKFCVAREKSIKEILKRKDRKPKVFDFIIFYNRKPVIVIETNFYASSGTKIGINQGEYTDLIQDLKLFNQNMRTNIKFMWVTDGDYWLTPQGESMFNNLKQNYFNGEYEILNYNILREKLPNLLNEMKDE